MSGTIFIEDLSKEEIAELSDEKIQRYIALACAEAGVALSLPPVPVKPASIHCTQDVEMFVFAGLNFASREQASEVQDLVSKCKLIEKGYGKQIDGNYVYYVKGTDRDVPNISTERLMSENNFNASRPMIDAYAAEMILYEKAKEAHDKSRLERESITADVMSLVREARRYMDKRKEIIALMAQYEDLADGNIKIAANFMQKFQPDAVDKFPDLFQDDWLKYSILVRNESIPAPLV